MILILVEPETPENLGFIARLAQNFDVSEVRIVTQKTLHLQEKAKRVAVHAADSIDRWRVFTSLEAATESCEWIVGFTARPRSALFDVQTLDAFLTAPERKTFRESPKLGLVFGRESSGLKDHELLLCHEVVTIPTSKTYTSLNLSHAVAIVLNSLFHPNRPKETVPKTHRHDLVSASDLERAQELWMQLLRRVGFASDSTQEHVRRHVKRLLRRTQLRRSELALLLGVARQTLWGIDHAQKPLKLLDAPRKSEKELWNPIFKMDTDKILN